MGLFGGGGGGVDLAPFLAAAREAQANGKEKIASFESVANQFAQLGQDNYTKSEEMYGSWKQTMDNYYSELNQNEFGAQTQQQMLLAQDSQYQATRNAMTSNGINPGSMFMLDMYDEAGMAGAQQQGQAQLDSKYAMYDRQNNWNTYGMQQTAQNFGQIQQGVGMQGQQTQAYANMYAGQASNAMQLMSQQQQYNQQAEGGGMFGTILGMAGTAVGAMYGGPAGAMAGGAIGGAMGGAIDG